MSNARIETIEEMWKDFESKTGLEKAPQVQRTEMRRAFYAGVISFHGVVTGPMCDLSDDDGIGVLEGFNEQIAAYVTELQLGRA